MLKKRLIANVVVKDDKVIQSIGYKKYLPIGSLESIVANLDRWEADEILITSIDRTVRNLGPNFELLKKLKKINLNTPIIYSGGVNSLDNAKKAIESGADRIVIETLVETNLKEIEKISEIIGSQSLILSIPLVIKKSKNNVLNYYDYKKLIIRQIPINFLDAIRKNFFSEILIIDPIHQGSQNMFDTKILKLFKTNSNLIIYGGISTRNVKKNLIKDNRIKAIAYGNLLNYAEHNIQKIKKDLNKLFRGPQYKN